MRKSLPTHVILALPLFLASLTPVACGSSHDEGFSPAGQSGDPKGGPGSSSGGGSSSSSSGGGLLTADASTSPTGNTNGMYVPPTALGCSSRAQDILILDFRSGWWAGGGGGGFTPTALGAVVGACAKTSVDYHHFETTTHVKCEYQSGPTGSCADLSAAVTVQDIEASLAQPSVSDYTQIWVLSGSDQDQSDIPVGDALFQGVMADTRGACIPMLIAAGDGFITHANTITQDFGMGTVFTEMTTPPGFFMADFFTITALSTMQAPELSSHLLFTNVTSIADSVASPLQQSRGDALAAFVQAPSIYDVIAHDGYGRPTIAVGAAKVAGDGYRPFIFDAGWQRMYTVGSDTGTAQYLKNIVMYLGLVGCKAAPIGTPQ